MSWLYSCQSPGILCLRFPITKMHAGIVPVWQAVVVTQEQFLRLLSTRQASLPTATCFFHSCQEDLAHWAAGGSEDPMPQGSVRTQFHDIRLTPSFLRVAQWPLTCPISVFSLRGPPRSPATRFQTITLRVKRQ